MDKATIIQIALAYVAIGMYKGWLTSHTNLLFLAALMRARYRKYGYVSLTYFALASLGSLLISTTLLIVWPVVWYVEGRYFWVKYNRFAIARSCMRISLRNHTVTTVEQTQCH